MNFKFLKIRSRVLPLILLLASCTSSYKSIYIETSQPSTDMLSNDISSLTLMNHGISKEFKRYDTDSLQNYFYSKDFNIEAVVLDSIAADTTMKVLGELLFESGRYDIVIPEDRYINRDLAFYRIPGELEWDEVEQICSEYNTDALLVIERYYNKLTTTYTTFPAMLGYESYGAASIDSKYNAVVKIYDPAKKEIAKQIVVDDTIYWYDSDVSTQNIFNKLPSIKECLIQTGIQVALEIDSKLSPQWVRENRSYYILDKKNSSQIANYISDDNWQAAYDYWLPYSSSQKTAEKSKAEFNLALASEMLGDINLAIEWANKAYFTQYRKQTENYLYKLKERKETIARFQEMINPE